MDNITWSKKSSATHDNGERNMCWRVGKPNESGLWLVTLDSGVIRMCLYDKSDDYANIDGTIIAYMKLPKPYKPD